MASTPSPQILRTVANEWEATAILSTLEAHGIAARTDGSFLSGFQVSAPAGIRILVDRQDLERARQCLAEQLAMHDAQNTEEEPATGTSGPAGQDYRRTFQFTLGGMLILQAIVSFILAFGRATGAAVSIGCLAFVFAVFLVVTATVEVASNLQRARRVWRMIGLWLVLGGIVFTLLLRML
jgi:hypothetical protein